MDATKIEERLAHLQRLADDLSEIVDAQQTRIERLERRLQMVMEREAEREISEGGTAPIADRPPPHW